ncbi:DUF4374 domain-containing protein [Rhodohalobacter sp. 614A]|uniref:DUF4374 domain-containing protein n=1 Tax=Rhodohalobacter sp. 614A TaxID=2908649 RepID=UPI001F2D1D15|nr:DUF4374 domain-containing protein [Rhodohalobacter sp. 614A]
MIHKLTNYTILLMLVIGIVACQDDNSPTGPDPEPDPDTYSYLLALSLPSIESYPFHTLTDIREGTADIAESQEVPGVVPVSVTGNDGYVYLNSPELLTKYEVGEDGILVNLGSVPNLGISGGPVFEFLSDTRLMISTGPRQAPGGVFGYQIIDTETMTEESQGTITLPTDENALSIPSSYILRDGKIFVPYIHTDENYVAFDEAPVAIYDASTLEYEKTIYTDKAACLGYSIISSHGIAENGDLYLAACNSDYWGANESIPSGIVRINAGETEFDDSYFLNLTEKFEGNHTGGMVYAGNNVAVVQVFRSDLVDEYGDYQGDFVIEYHAVNLESGATQKLDVPLSKWPRRSMQLLDDGTVAIVGNTQSEGNNIYIFDPADYSVTKGLVYEGAELINSLLVY